MTDRRSGLPAMQPPRCEQLEELPLAVLEDIGGFLKIQDRTRLTGVSRRLRRALLGSKTLWRASGLLLGSPQTAEGAAAWLRARKGVVQELRLGQATLESYSAALPESAGAEAAWAQLAAEAVLGALGGGVLRTLTCRFLDPLLLTGAALGALSMLRELRLDFEDKCSDVQLAAAHLSSLTHLSLLDVQLQPRMYRPSPQDLEDMLLHSFGGYGDLMAHMAAQYHNPHPRPGGNASWLQPGCLPGSLRSLRLCGLPHVPGELFATATALTHLAMLDCGGLERLPPQLAGLTALQSLAVEEGCIAWHEPAPLAPISHLPSLTQLSLSRSGIPGQPGMERLPTELGACQAPCALDLLGHELASAGDSWRVLLPLRTSLTRLGLGFCGLKSLPQELASLTALQDLDLQNNAGLSKGPPTVLHALGALSSLTRLSFRNCFLDPLSLPALPSLKALDATRNGPFAQPLPMGLSTLTAPLACISGEGARASLSPAAQTMQQLRLIARESSFGALRHNILGAKLPELVSRLPALANLQFDIAAHAGRVGPSPLGEEEEEEEANDEVDSEAVGQAIQEILEQITAAGKHTGIRFGFVSRN